MVKKKNAQNMAALVRSLRRLAVTPYFRRAVPALSYSTKSGPAGMQCDLQLFCTGHFERLCFLCTEDTIATDFEQATGLEKKELDAKAAGIDV